MEPNFFMETYPIALLYGVFILALFFNVIAWLEVGPNPETYTFVPQGFMFRGGGRGAVMHLLFEFIARHPILYRLLAMATLGVWPVYLRLSHGNESYKMALYILLGLYLFWIFEKIVRLTLVKFIPPQQPVLPKNCKLCPACQRPVEKIMQECPHCQTRINL